jgi:hypothetical protein
MTSEPADQQEVDIEAAFKEGTPIEEALNRGVREAVLLHRRLGLPMAVWRDNRVVWIDPDGPDDGSTTAGVHREVQEELEGEQTRGGERGHD